MQKIDKVIIYKEHDFISSFAYSDGKLCFMVTDQINPPYSEAIIPIKVSRINHANNSAFIEYDDNQTGYINLPKWLKVQSGSKLHAQLTWQGDEIKQAKFRSTWQIAGKYIVYNSKSELKFANKNLPAELLDKLNSLLSNQPATWSIRTIAINNTDYDLISSEAQEIYAIAEKLNSNKEYTYSGIPNYLKIFRELNLVTNAEVTTNDDSIYNKLIEKQDLWLIDTIHYNKNLQLPLLDIANHKKLVQLENGSTLEIGTFAGINIIDINSGSSNTDKNTTNFLILDEVYRQICVQNLQGIILVDVIKNSSILQEGKIINYLQKLFRHDISQTKILGFSNSGLLEIIRNKF